MYINGQTVLIQSFEIISDHIAQVNIRQKNNLLLSMCLSIACNLPCEQFGSGNLRKISQNRSLPRSLEFLHKNKKVIMKKKKFLFILISERSIGKI